MDEIRKSRVYPCNAKYKHKQVWKWKINYGDKHLEINRYTSMFGITDSVPLFPHESMAFGKQVPNRRPLWSRFRDWKTKETSYCFLMRRSVL